MQLSKSTRDRTAINTVSDTRTTWARLVSCRGILIRDVTRSQRLLFPTVRRSSCNWIRLSRLNQGWSAGNWNLANFPRTQTELGGRGEGGKQEREGRDNGEEPKKKEKEGKINEEEKQSEERKRKKDKRNKRRKLEMVEKRTLKDSKGENRNTKKAITNKCSITLSPACVFFLSGSLHARAVPLCNFDIPATRN
jgi:hypothetical protein